MKVVNRIKKKNTLISFNQMIMKDQRWQRCHNIKFQLLSVLWRQWWRMCVLLLCRSHRSFVLQMKYEQGSAIYSCIPSTHRVAGSRYVPYMLTRPPVWNGCSLMSYAFCSWGGLPCFSALPGRWGARHPKSCVKQKSFLLERNLLTEGS